MNGSYKAERIHQRMNSKKLFRGPHTQEKYKEIFAKSCVVCSAPGVAFWGGEHNVLGGGISICQPFPLRVWVGLEPGDRSQGIELGDHFVLDASSAPFHFSLAGRNEWKETIELPNFRKPKDEALITEIEKMCDLEGLEHRSFRIHVLSEFPPRLGANWSGAFSAALSGAILALNGLLDQPTIGSWKSRPAYELSRDPIFDKCNRWAWHFETILHSGAASGYGSFTSLVGGRWPICFFTEERRSNGRPPINVISDSQDVYAWNSRETWLEHIQYSGFRLDDVFQVEKPPVIYGLLSSGQPKDTGKAILRGRGLSKYLEEARKDLAAFFSKNKKALGHLSTAKVPFLPLCKLDGDTLLTKYYDALSVNCIEVFHVVRQLFTGQADDLVLRNLARVLSGVHGSLMQTAQNWPLGEYPTGTLLCMAEDFGIGEKVGVKMTGGGGGGFLFFMAPQLTEKEEEFEDTLLGRIEGLQEHWNSEFCKKINLTWISTMDELEDEGLRIELPLGLVSHHNDRFGEVQTFPGATVLWTKGEREWKRRYDFELDYLKSLPDMIYADRRASAHIDDQLRIGGVPYRNFSGHQPIVPSAKLLAVLARSPNGQTKISDIVQALGSGYQSHIRTLYQNLERFAVSRGLNLEFYEDGELLRLRDTQIRILLVTE